VAELWRRVPKAPQRAPLPTNALGLLGCPFLTPSTPALGTAWLSTATYLVPWNMNSCGTGQPLYGCDSSYLAADKAGPKACSLQLLGSYLLNVCLVWFSLTKSCAVWLVALCVAAWHWHCTTSWRPSSHC